MKKFIPLLFVAVALMLLSSHTSAQVFVNARATPIRNAIFGRRAAVVAPHAQAIVVSPFRVRSQAVVVRPSRFRAVAVNPFHAQAVAVNPFAVNHFAAPLVVRGNRAFISSPFVSGVSFPQAVVASGGFIQPQQFVVNPSYVDPGFRAVRAFSTAGFGFPQQQYYQPQVAFTQVRQFSTSHCGF